MERSLRADSPLGDDAAVTPQCALVLETNNLRGGDDPAAVVATLARLLHHLRAQTRSIDALDELVITHDGLDARSQSELTHAAGRPLVFVEIPPGAGYYEAKNIGFDATRAEVVVFGDGDCWPDSVWLEAVLAPFADPAVQVVAGRTTYRDDLLGAAATAIDFMYFPSTLGEDCTRNFYANNVAFRRETFARFRYLPAARIYRGHCQQLGFRLHAAGVPIRFAARARTTHRFPDTARELVRLRLLRGADTVAVAPALMQAVLPDPLSQVGRVPGLAPLAILGARLAFSARAVNSTAPSGGRTRLRRILNSTAPSGGRTRLRRILNRQDLTPARGLAHAACLAGVLGLSLLDAAGALARTARVTDLGVRDGSLDRERLGYHGNGDALGGPSAAE